jgi:hypothetical protein
MRFLLILYLWVPVLAFGESWEDLRQEQADCYARPLGDPTLKELSLFAKSLDLFLGVGKKVDETKYLNEWEKLVLKKHPDLGMVLGNIRCRAQALAVTVCGLDPEAPGAQKAIQDEEGDALRHFFFAFLLASAKGEDLATLYTSAHEGDPNLWTERELMDLDNNDRAIGIYREYREAGAEPNFSDQTLAAVGLKALREGRLTTLAKGNTRCAEGAIHELKPTELLKDLRKNYRTLRKFQSCRLPFWLF